LSQTRSSASAPLFSAAFALWFFIGVSTASVGCASADSLQRLASVPAQNVVESPSIAAARAKAVALKPGELRRLELAGSDEVVKIDNQRSFFKVLSVPLEVGPLARIQVASRCDCVGFRKFLFVPLVFVFDGEGQPVPLELPEFEPKDADMSNPLRLVATWTFPVGSAGTYRVLVAADNRFAGRSVATARGSNMSGGLLSALIAIHVTAVAVGEFTFLAPPR
jgi:hypothetical protein